MCEIQQVRILSPLLVYIKQVVASQMFFHWCCTLLARIHFVFCAAVIHAQLILVWCFLMGLGEGGAGSGWVGLEPFCTQDGNALPNEYNTLHTEIGPAIRKANCSDEPKQTQSQTKKTKTQKWPTHRTRHINNIV